MREQLREGAVVAARGLGWARVIDDLEAIFGDLVTRSRAARLTTTAGSAGTPRIAETDRAPL